MTLTPNQAQKYFWLNLSRNLETVDESDVPADAISINNMTLTSLGYARVQIDLDLENTVDQSLDMTLVIYDNSYKVTTKQVSFTNLETKSVSYTIYTGIGNREITVSVGNNSQTETIRILY